MKEAKFDFDLIVVGAGYGGFDAAKHAAEHGLNQPFIEEETNHITSTEDSFIEEPTVSNNKNLYLNIIFWKVQTTS